MSNSVLSKPLTVVHIISGLAVGGAEMMLYKLVSATDRQLYRPVVISLISGGELQGQIEAEDVPVYSLGMQRGLSSIGALSKLRRFISELQPDIIQGWMYHGNLAAIIARTIAPGRPFLVWSIRQSLYDLRYEKLLTRQVIRLNRFFSLAPDSVLYNSHLSKRQHEDFGFSKEKSKVIFNGFDLEKFSFSPGETKDVCSSLAIPSNAVCIGHVGRHHFMKDHPVFLVAAREIAGRYPNTYFLLSGKDVVPENKELVTLVPEQLRSRFFFLGERKDIPAIMQSLDIFVSSSLAEGFPNVLGEAMAVGVPCVATDVGDSSVVVGPAGMIVKSRNKDALVEAMDHLFSLPEEERQYLGRKGRLRIEQHFSIKAIAAQYSELYQQLMSTRIN